IVLRLDLSIRNSNPARYGLRRYGKQRYLPQLRRHELRFPLLIKTAQRIVRRRLDSSGGARIESEIGDGPLLVGVAVESIEQRGRNDAARREKALDLP